DERHRDVLDAVDLAHVVNAYDIAVRHLPRQQQFLLEAPLDVAHGDRIPGDLGPHHLHRHHHAQLGVPGLIHGAHAADAEQPHDDVAGAELLTDVERPL